MDDISAFSRGRGGAGQVFAILREEIIGLRLKPGEVLSRLELQERFGLSSTPVRDALMRLQDEGLVAVYPQHATLVSPIDIDRARQAQFLRRSIEIELVHVLTARGADPALIERLRSLIRQQSAFAELGEHEAFAAADQAFHRTMYEAGQVIELWHLVRRQSGHIDRLRRLHLPLKGKMPEILSAHAEIVDAMAAGDAATAAAALRQHLSRSLLFVDTLRQTYPDYFAPAR